MTMSPLGLQHRTRQLALMDVITTTVRGFVAGSAVGLALRLTRSLSRLRKRRKRHREESGEARDRSSSHMLKILQTMARYGLTMAGASATYAVGEHLLTKAFGSRNGAPLAVGLSSCWMLRLPEGSLREGISLIMLSRALMVLGKGAVLDKWIPPSQHYATIVFCLSCFEIMKAWFYNPSDLPKEYVEWITAMAEMDLRLIRALRLLCSGEVEIGAPFDGDFLQSYVADHGLSPKIGDPALGRMCCSTWHHPDTCAQNVGRRAFRAVRATLPLYFAVHLMPRLLLPRTLLRAPVATSISIGKNVLRSSAFLSTFIVSIWISVCSLRKVRGSLIKLLNADPVEFDKWWDPRETWGPLLGCALCGLSIQFEPPSRRPVLALYVSSRALASAWRSWGLPVTASGDIIVFSASSMLLALAAHRRPEISDVWLGKQLRSAYQLIRR